MRQGWPLLWGLAAACLAGCINAEQTPARAWRDYLGPLQGLVGPDVIQMDVALLQCPLGDRYINQDLWNFTDEQVIDLEKKAALEDNGFRVGQVGGIAPPGLQDLLTSSRSCVNPHRLQLHAGTARSLELGPPLAKCRFDLRQEGRSVPVTWKGARCVLQVVPTLTQDGRTRLHFTPQIQHGDKVRLPRPAPDHSGWEQQEQTPTEDYPSLSWDVFLSPNEYVIVGTRFEHRGTLGSQCFLRPEEPVPVQRLLVIRTGRPAEGLPAETSPEEDEKFPRSSPLALQASLTSARGSAP
ncbi:MAG: hypothetical protein JO112_06735 [Planctomycetes bacterium]|nr:hypothetical protein [Planctomycetota bacterium]